MKNLFSKKILVMFSIILALSSLSSVVSASGVIKPQADVETIDVKNIVPEEYILKYQNKFSSLEEVRKAAGYDNQNATTTQLPTESDEYIKVDSVDEYAALLFYYNDLFEAATSSESVATANAQRNSNLIQPASTYDTYYITHESTFNDTYIAWNKAYVIAEYKFSDDKIVGTPVADSQYFGFTPGTSWTHNDKKSIVNVNSARTGGSAKIVGTLSLYVIIESIGQITSRELSHSMTF